MYEELVKRLRYCSEEHSGCGVCELSEECALRAGLLLQAAEAIEKLCGLCASQSKDCSEAVAKYLELWAKQPRWISVEERLPLRGDAVLCVGDNGIVVADFVCGDKWCALPWFYNRAGEQETGVTHWMPLPEPPKEE